MDVLDALVTRRSVRGFAPDRPIAKETLSRLFEAAQRAPSWCNIQPWRAWVTSGEATARLTAALTAAASSGPPRPELPFPVEYPPPYDALRRRCGGALYAAMGVAREDGAGRYGAWMRNYVAFDAPHVVIVGIDRSFGLYAALDVGCWLQSLLLAATAAGIGTCAQASLSGYPDVTRDVLGIPDEIAIVFGVALGYEDPAVPANRCRTDRQPHEDNVRFVESV